MLPRVRRRAPVTAAVLAASLFMSTAAGAQTAPPPVAQADVLQLTDGTSLTGRVLELRLFQDATILLADGTTRTVPWTALASASADIWNLNAAAGWRPQPMPPVAPMYPPPVGPDDLLHPGPGRVPLHVESDGTPQIVGIGAPGRRREALGVLCTTPCTLFVFPGVFPLYTGGPDVRSTVHPVIVTASGANVIAHAGSPVGRGLGAALIPLGVIGLIASGVLMSDSPSSGLSQGFGGILGLGSVAVIVGGAMMIGNARPGLTYVGPMGSGIGVGARF